MDLRQFRYFSQVARRENFRKASEDLRVAQSAVTRQIQDIALKTPGVSNAVAFAGFSGATFTNATNAAAVFLPFTPFEERVKQGLSANAIIGDVFKRMQAIDALPEFSALRDAARDLKNHVLSRLDEYLVEFEGNVVKNGGLY